MPSPAGLWARRWRRVSLRAACAITYPVFPTPQTTLSVDLSPSARAAQGMSHACWERLGLSHRAATWGLLVGGRGPSRVGSLAGAQVSSSRLHPGPRRRSGETQGSQGGGRQKSGEQGTPPSTLSRPHLGLSQDPGRLLPRLKRFGGPRSSVPASGHPSLKRSAAANPAAQSGDHPR